MDREPPYRRRRARAIAINTVVDAQKKAFAVKMFVLLGALAVLIEGVPLTQHLLAAR